MNKKIIRNQFLLALITFIFSQLVLALILKYTNSGYFNSANWQRWDSGHYLQIATNGYEFFSCAGKFGYPPDAKEFCGNTGWFPGYPLLIKIFTLFFKDATLVGGVLSKIFYLLSLFMVLRITDTREITFRNILFTAIPAFSFGFIYYNAIFPISAVLFFALSGLYFFLRGKIKLTGLFCFLASFFYPTGFLLAGVFALAILLRGKENLKQKFLTLLIPSVMGVLGLLCAFLIFQLTVNDWSAFIKVQAKYGHDFYSPIKNIKFFLKSTSLKTYAVTKFIHYQSITILASYLLLTVLFFYKKMFKDELYLWAYIYVSIFLIFPWSVGGDLSRYRAESLLLPFVLLLNRVKALWLAGILVCLLIIGIPMSYLFFTGVLI